MKFFLLVWFGLSIAAGATEIRRGEIHGAKFATAVPEDWQGKLVLIAHGFRSEDAALGADLDVTDEFTAPLLKQGWAVAVTSYRRNGWIIEDAIEDLKNLRDHVAGAHGEVKRCVVVGNSMGGLIATLIAEGAMKGVDGVVAIGAYLGDGKTKAFYSKLSWKPGVPILYLINQDELVHPEHYRRKAGAERTALWTVKRNGHCNTSDAERLNAILAVDAWIDGKAPEREKDETVPTPRRASSAKKVDGGLQGTIRQATESWGNLSTDFVAVDLEALGLKIGDKAIVTSESGKLGVTVVTYRSDAGEGKGVLYVSADGWVLVQIAGGNAAKALGVKSGDMLRISKAS